MLGPADAVVLAAGVRVDGASVVDEARTARFPVNETGLFVLRRAGRPLGDVARELATRHGIDLERARSDVLLFALSLNRALLANIEPGDGRARRAAQWLLLACRLVPAGLLPTRNVRRCAVDTTTPAHAIRDACGALRRRFLVLVAGVVVLVAPGGGSSIAHALGLGVGAGVVVHEAGHAALLSGVAAALVVSGLRTYVIHPTLGPGRRQAVAAAGPGLACAIGVAAVVAGWYSGLPELALAGCPAAAHAVGLTVATGDGRVACGL
jgi:hypothetical protein